MLAGERSQTCPETCIRAPLVRSCRFGDAPGKASGIVGDGTLLPDPLVVVPFSQVLHTWDDSPPDVGVEGRPFVAEVAPDAICKAHRSGQSYLITLPGVGMDALLENERHGLSFVDYLRLALQWGGFPGFESAGQRPKEVELLSDGLLTF